MRSTIVRTLATAVLAVAIGGGPATAGELGHFNPGIANIRDFLVPPPGWYVVAYNYFYTTDRLNDADGDEVDSVTIAPKPGPGVTLDLEVDLDLYALSPMVMWVTPWQVAGARYAAYIAPGFATSSLSAALDTAVGIGRSGDVHSCFGAGDVFVSPIWLGWPLEHWDLAFGYGFYAPVGRYDVETVTLPVVGPVEVEAEDNLGLGFWTHQLQGAVAWYPSANRGTAVVGALTYELNGSKEDFDVTPGSRLTLNWGASQYLPVTEDQTLLLEVGVSGYDQWKLSKDSGGDAVEWAVLDSVHAIGAQLGLSYTPWSLAANLRYDVEYASRGRFQGQVLILGIVLKL